jgi:predicted ATPase/class 3 adenylate cyclase
VGSPSGTVTFLFTDVEGSTRLWEDAPTATRDALARHDEALRSAIETHNGYVFSTGGDGFAAAFDRAGNGLAAAVDAQLAFNDEAWPDGLVVKVRMGLHTGEADERDGNYFGSAVNRAARLMTAAHGGQIVVSELTAALLADAPGVGLIDLGSHHLRGFVGPTRVFGVKADGLPWLDLPLATAEAVRGNLPRPMTEWFGPTAELHRRVADLARRRLVTLTGPGGVGKTRLAVEIGSLTTDEFPDGVWMVELASVAEPDAVLAAVAAALGVIAQDGLPLGDSVVDWLEERRLLLILDNCEHVLAPIGELVARIGARVPTVTVLVTSREPLGLAGERVVAVPSLAPHDAVELFCDRASAADESLVFAAAERDIIADICRRLDGIPLAVELAAARVRSLGLPELQSRLGDRFRLLRGAGRGSIERHQTLRATVAWSYQLLGEAERLLFDRLSVFAAGFDLRAAEAVGGSGPVEHHDVADLLPALVDKSLVTVERGTGAGVRYQLLETLRQFGEEELRRRDEIGPTRDRHLAHYLGVAAWIGDRWAGPDSTDAAATFRAEIENLRAAHAHALAGQDVAAADAILDATFGPAVMELRREHGEWAAATVALTGAQIRPATYGYAASWAWRAGDGASAIDLATRGIAAAPGRDDPTALLCWAYLVLAAVMSGRFAEAQDAVPHLKAAAANEAANPLHQVAVSAAFVMLAALGDREASAAQLDRLDAIVDRTGSTAFATFASFLRGIGLRLAEPPDLDGALAAHRRSLGLATEIGAMHMVLGNLTTIGSFQASQGTTDAGIACRTALKDAYEARAWNLLWTVLVATASYLQVAGDEEAAVTVLGYLEAHEPGALAYARLIGVNKPADVPENATTKAWKSRGAAMDRHAIVRFALGELPGSP